MRIPVLFTALLLGGCAMSDTPSPTSPPADALMTWPDLTNRERPSPDATVAYGDNIHQKVDVWLPEGVAPYPTVLMVHGGCWQTNIADRSLMDWVADDLRESGYAVWNIDYRGVDIAGGGYPGTFRDAATATDLLRADAKRFHLDMSRIVAVGHSAGGHLALWLAGRRKLPASSALAGGDPLSIDHVVSLGGLPDLKLTANSPDNGCGTDVISQLVGPKTPDHADIYADTSVPSLLPLGIAQDMVDGREDHIIPIRLPEDYTAKAKAAGDDATLHIVPHTGHVELIAPETAAWAETKKLIAKAFEDR